MPTVPYLAGLPAAYIEGQLSAMAEGARQGGAMTALARTLSAPQRRAVAQHYAALPRGAAPVPHVGSKPPALGRELAEHGRWSQNLPACVLCHGRNGLGVGSAFPPLAGQPAAYLAAQLHAFRRATRPAGPLGLMKLIASKLSDADIRAVSDYFSSLSPAIRQRTAR